MNHKVSISGYLDMSVNAFYMVFDDAIFWFDRNDMLRPFLRKLVTVKGSITGAEKLFYKDNKFYVFMTVTEVDVIDNKE